MALDATAGSKVGTLPYRLNGASIMGGIIDAESIEANDGIACASCKGMAIG
jgi:hypothetical protein